MTYLSLEAPRAKTMGSAISSMDCRMEATTMKRMMERRKARWMTCSSIKPVCTARISSVMPSVIPLHMWETDKIEIWELFRYTASNKQANTLTCAWHCHWRRLCSPVSRTCRAWELPARWMRRWKPDPAESMAYYNILQYCKHMDGEEERTKGESLENL